jgi:hypothetical protein
MSIRRYSPGHRLITLLLVAVMPICCCVVKSFSGSACCGTASVEATVEVASCCMARDCDTEMPAESSEPASDASGRCGCCAKVTPTTLDWTPPVDTIGSPLLLIAFSGDLGEATTPSIRANRRPGVPKGHPGPGLLRGTVILQV